MRLQGKLLAASMWLVLYYILRQISYNKQTPSNIDRGFKLQIRNGWLPTGNRLVFVLAA